MSGGGSAAASPPPFSPSAASSIALSTCVEVSSRRLAYRGLESTRASPKSHRRTTPKGVAGVTLPVETRMLAGFRSRWMPDMAWTCVRPAHSCAMNERTLFTSSDCFDLMILRMSDSINSVIMKMSSKVSMLAGMASPRREITFG